MKQPLSHNQWLNDKRPEAKKALEQTADSLSVLASSNAPAMDSKVKSRQRDMLMAEARKHTGESIKPASASRYKEMKTNVHRPWYFWFTSITATVAVAMLALVILPSLSNKAGNPTHLQPATFKQTLVQRLTIPEAVASDAFSLSADKTDESGTATNTAFILQSKIDVSADDVLQSLQIEPAVDVSVLKTGDREFKVVPKEPLSTGAVYRVAVATSVEKSDGSVSEKDFSWAFQTKDDFRVLSTIPADGASEIPVNTGIEFKFSMDGFAEPGATAVISPETKGSWKVSNRTLTFIPTQPLKNATRYEITLKKGFGVKNSDLVLANDIKIRFETSPEKYPYEAGSQIRLSPGEYVETRTNEDWLIPAGWIPDQYASTTVEVKAYPLSLAEAKDLLVKRLSIPDWVAWSRYDYNEYKWVTGKETAFTMETALMRKQQYGQLSLLLPKQEKTGWFALQLQPKNGLVSWTLVQVTDRAIYSTSDKDTTVLWAIDAKTKRPISGLNIQMDGTKSSTDNQGIARVPTPAFLTTSTSDMVERAPLSVIEFTKDNETSLMVIRKSGFQIMNFMPNQIPEGNTWNYLYLDRALYHPTDELYFAAFVQDRDTREPLPTVTVQIQKNDWTWWVGNGNKKIYQSMTLMPDAQGFVQGKFNWDAYVSGYYTVNVMRNGKLIGSRSFEVRQFAKPSYHIDVTLDKERLMEGEKITGTIKAAFFDGSPVSNAKFIVEGQTGWMSKYGNKIAVTSTENGEARFEIAVSSSRAYVAQDDRVPTSYSQNIIVTPQTGEEGFIQGRTWATVYTSESDLVLQPKTSDLKAILGIKTTRVDFSKADAENKPWANRPVKVTYQSMWWEKVETGRNYDEFTKQTNPTYEYRQRMGELITRESMSNEQGKVSLEWNMEEGKYYKVDVETRDEQGRIAKNNAFIGRGWYDNVTYPESSDQSFTAPSPYYIEGPRLTFVPENAYGDFKQGSAVKTRYLYDNQPLNTESESPVLYVLASRGIQEAKLGTGADLEFTLADRLIPNVEVHAIAFIKDQFQPVQISARVDIKDKRLNVEANVDRDQYRPGDEVVVSVNVKNASTNESAGKTTLIYAVVDKALLDITGDYDEDVLNKLYEYVPDGIIQTMLSQETGLTKAFGDAGAEMGGGGGEAGNAVRKLFKDTVTAGIVETDNLGRASFSFKVPDNLTSWRVQVVAIQPKNMMGGTKRVEAKVTKNVYLDVVLPPRMLVGDKPVMQLRTVGRGLLSDTAINYTVTAPTLGVDQKVAGKANVSTYLEIPTLPVGRHKLIFRVETPSGSDALERTIEVVDSNFSKREYTTIAATPGAGLPASEEAETELLIANGGKASLLNQINELAYGWTGRADSRAAALIARNYLQEVMGTAWTPTVPPMSEFQDVNGGIKLLPYGTVDLEVSSEIASTAPEFIDRKVLANYLYGIIDQKDASRTMLINAYAGLAALQENGLSELRRLSVRTDLTTREKLIIARGLVAAGDMEAARELYEALLAGSQEQDGMLILVNLKSDGERYLVTADMAALAAGLQDSRAELLQKYVESNWSKDEFPMLAKARYLKAMMPTLPAKNVTIRYTTDGQTEQNISLSKNEVAKTLTLTKAERAGFRITYIDGLATLSYQRSTVGKPTPINTIALTRRYEASRPLSDLRDGDEVKVTLTPEFKAGAKQGCYQLTDYLPGNTQSVVSWGDYGFWMEKITVPAIGGDRGIMSFVTCYNPEDKQDRSVSYKFRIVSRGSFKAESPLMQHLDQLSQVTLGTDQLFNVK